MSLVTTPAFILRLDTLSEKDLAVSFLTRDHGVVRGSVKGARGRSSRKGAALQLLTEVSLTYFRRQGRELVRVDALDIERSAFALAGRAETAMLLPYLAESAQTFVPENEPGTDVFRLLRHALDALEADASPELVARYFEVWLLRFAGLLPEAVVCALCGAPLGADTRLEPEIPGFAHAACARPAARRISARALALLAAMRRSALPSLEAPEGASVLPEIEDLTREVRRRFLGHELKSYRFLRLC